MSFLKNAVDERIGKISARSAIIKIYTSGFILALCSPSYALNTGDIFFVGNGPSRTVINILKGNNERIEFTAQILDANAAEYCSRYERIEPFSDRMKACIQKNIKPSENYVVTCRNPTIINNGGSYRPSNNGGPWRSVANHNWIIQGDSLFQKACGKLRLNRNKTTGSPEKAKDERNQIGFGEGRQGGYLQELFGWSEPPEFSIK